MKKYIPEDYILQKINVLPFTYREVLKKILKEAPYIFVKTEEDEI